jgi:hypothetical protein
MMVISAVVRRYCELTKREVAGLATSQLAAEKLGAAAGIRTRNTARAAVLEARRPTVSRWCRPAASRSWTSPRWFAARRRCAADAH